MYSNDNVQTVLYLPILTTILSASFGVVLLLRYRHRRTSLHLLWWGLGMWVYGTGTALAASITVTGNSVLLTKAWFIVGAVLTGYPLAQGSLYLLMPRALAHRTTLITAPIVLAIAAAIILSPVIPGSLEMHRPSGGILAWNWARMSILIVNGYATLGLAGGALYSILRWSKENTDAAKRRVMGNSLILLGSLLPGIGGGFAKLGMTEMLYIGECAGLMLIWAGFTFNTWSPIAPTSTPTSLAAA
jgi:hypothetical protein